MKRSTINNQISRANEGLLFKKSISHQSATAFIFMLMVMMLLACSSDDAAAPVEPKTLNGNVLLQTQEEVDDFAQERITHIAGNLVIGNTFRQGQIQLSELTSISALSTLVEVEGDLVIFGNAELQSLEGLERLEKIGGDMVISFNIALSDIDALSGLNSINGKLSIQSSGNITSLQVLNGLSGIQDLDVSSMSQLTTLFDMSNVSQIGELRLDANPLMVNLEGLANTAISDIKIAGNDALENLKGLESTVNLESLELRYNESLRTVEGLENLKSIYQQITLQYNESLQGLQHMGTLETGPVMLRVEDNPKLTSLGNFKMRNVQSEEDHWAGFYNNPELTSLSPLSELTSLNNLQVSNNDKITDLKDLSNLTQVGHFNIIANDLLTDLQGLENLREVEILSVSGNLALTSLKGLSGLTTVKRILQVSANEALTDLCEITGLAGNDGIPSEFNVAYNAFNPSLEDLKNGKCSD